MFILCCKESITPACVYVHTASTKQNNKRTMNQKESKDLIVYTKICSQIDLHKFNLYLCFWWTRSKAMLSPLIEWNSMFLYFFNFYKMNVIQYTIHSFVFGLKRFFIMFLLLFFLLLLLLPLESVLCILLLRLSFSLDIVDKQVIWINVNYVVANWPEHVFFTC